jgi:hypothetical protein
MRQLRTLRKLILGETWILPLGIAALALAVALVVRPLSGDDWSHAGGFVLLAGVAVVLAASVARSGGRR